MSLGSKVASEQRISCAWCIARLVCSFVLLRCSPTTLLCSASQPSREQNRPPRLANGRTGGCRSCVELAQQAAAWVADTELAVRITDFAIVFAYTVKQVLRREPLFAVDLDGIINSAEVRRIRFKQQQQHVRVSVVCAGVAFAALLFRGHANAGPLGFDTTVLPPWCWPMRG